MSTNCSRKLNEIPRAKEKSSQPNDTSDESNKSALAPSKAHNQFWTRKIRSASNQKVPISRSFNLWNFSMKFRINFQ